MGFHDQPNRAILVEPMGESVSGSPESAPTTGPDRHWFVAIDDVDVGPIDIAEIEARWRAGELSASSLAWRPGMAEWQTIDTIAALAYLLEQLDQPAAEPELPTVQWVMGNATSLSDLVAMELEDPTVVRPAATQAPAPTTQSLFADNESMGLPDLSSLGFSGGGGQKQVWDDGWGVPSSPGPASFPPGPAPWLDTEPDHSKRNLMVALIGGGFLVLTIGLVLAIVELVQSRQPVAPPKTEVAALQPKPAKPQPEAPELEPVAPKPEPKPEPVVAPTPKPTPRRTTTTRRTTPKPKPRPKPKPKPAAGTRLSKADILTGIKSNARNLMPCLKSARAKGEVTAGRIKFVLNWTIEADGGVSRPKLKGPSRVLGTSLPKCFTSQMRAWKFPASSRSSNIKNFGLPIKLR